MAGPQFRNLPRYSAGAITVPFTVGATAEHMTQEVVWGEHSHPTHELVWNGGGASTITVGDVTWTTTGVWALWIPAGTLHSGVTPANTTCRTAHFNIDTSRALAERCIPVELTPLLSQLLDRLNTDLEPQSRELTERMIVDVMCPAEHELSITVPRSTVVAPVVHAVLNNPGSSLSLRQWASRLRVSTRTITRAFQEETGHSFTRWQASVRAQHAVILLSAGTPTEEVASRTGYATVSSFGAAFRRTTGLTPGVFRPVEA